MKSKIGEKKCYNIFEKNELGAIEKMGQVSEMISKDGYKRGIIDGKIEGIKLGEENTTTAHIIAMLKKGISIEDISEITKKSKQDIISIKEKNKL